jgi:PKD repeat protein
VLLFGWESLSGFVRDTWTYSNGLWTNVTSTVGPPPPGAVYSLMAYDPSTQKVVEFSGANNTTWTYHAGVWTNVTAVSGTHPASLIEESFVTDSTDREAVLFGGINVYGSNFAQVTWVYKNGTWSNVTSTAPFNFGRIELPVGADDPTDSGVLAVGISLWHNSSPFLVRPATFLFSGGHWTNLTSTLPLEPPMGELFTMAWLPSLSADVMESPILINSTGQLGSSSGATWEFSHGLWKNVTDVTGPQPDTGLVTASAVDPIDGTMLMFGGQRLVSPIVYPGTWLFSAPPTVTASISKASVDAGQPVTLTGAVSGGASPNSVRWNLGDGTNSTTLSGAHTYSKTGEVTATLTVTDLVGHTVFASASVFVNPALTLSANATPVSPVNGTWVALTSQVTGGTAPFTFSWTLGDGSSSSVSSLGHVYAHAGNYTVGLNVTDSAGATKAVTFQVAVQAAPTPSHPPSPSSSSSVSLTSGTGLYLLLGIILLLVIVVALAAMLAMRPRSPPGTLTAYPVTQQPPPGGTPPPGAGGPPSS